jgi:hypothetical protein
MVADMKLKTFPCLASLIALAACAQSPLPQLRIEPIGGGSVFFVKNVASQPLTAYLIELVDYPGSSYALAQDEIGANPIPPNTEKRIQVSNMTVGAVPDYVKVQAAIYADGTTAGTPEKIRQLIDRRRETLQAVRATIDQLQKAQEANTPKEQLIATLKQALGNRVLKDTAARIEKQSVQETLAELRALESALKASRPPL